MKIKVTKDEVKITELPKVHTGEYKANVCEFEFSEEWDSLVKKAVFTYKLDEPIKMDIVDNKCDIPVEVLKYGEVKIGVYGYTVDGEDLVLRYSPTPDKWFVVEGSYVTDAQNSEGGTPTEYEQLESRVNKGLDDVAEAVANAENLDIDAEKVDTTTTVTITKQDGSTKTVLILDGKEGKKGDKGDTGSVKFVIVTVLPTEDIDESAIYLVPNLDAETDNAYIEYIYVDGKWEKFGETQIEVDLSDYVKNTDYATDSVGGVIKTRAGFNFDKDSSGRPFARTRDYETYNSQSNDVFISKGTLENVITGKGLVSNTDYATDSVGGVVKVYTNYGLSLDNGRLRGITRSYDDYLTSNNLMLISKITLENVLNARIGDIDTVLNSINGEVI